MTSWLPPPPKAKRVLKEMIWRLELPNDELRGLHDVVHGNKGGSKNMDELVASLCTAAGKEYGRLLSKQCIPADVLRFVINKLDPDVPEGMLKAMKKAEIVQWLAASAKAEQTKPQTDKKPASKSNAGFFCHSPTGLAESHPP